MKNSKGMIFLLAGLASLTLIIAVAYFFFSRDQGTPKPTPAPVAGSPTTTGTPTATALPDAFDPVEWTRNPQTTGTGLDTSATGDTPNGGFVVTMPQDKTTGKTGADANPSATPTVDFPDTTAKTSTTPKVDFPDTTTTKTTTPKAVAKKPLVKPAPAAPVKTVTVTEFWIQVGAFKDRYQAEAVSKTLENEGLKGTLTTANVNGATVVRVRVGPYTNQDEAKKFLAWVTPVKGLEGSYITSTKATRTE